MSEPRTVDDRSEHHETERHPLVIDGLSSEGLPSRYVLDGEIGRGGMGLIIRVHDRLLGRNLALKVLHKKYRTRSDMVQRFLDEASIAGQLQHPGVAPIHDLGTLADGRPFFTMKLVKGRTLAELLSRRTDPADDLAALLQVFEQVCQTVAFAHAKGVLHRDLKPSNVMVGAFGEVQVMDWGLAKALSGAPVAAEVQERPAEPLSLVHTERDLDTEAGSLLGTPAYMAPEQARGEVEHLDARSDVFALGAILCEVLTGQPPYVGSSTEVKAQAQLGHLAPARQRLEAAAADGELVKLALACLSADRQERPPDATAVAESVRAYRHGVEERLQRAELERAAAGARAEEARATARAEQARAKEAEAREAAERRQAAEAQARATAEQARAEEAEAKEAAQRARATEAEARAAAERRARRLTLGLAASVLLLAAAGGTGAWLVQRHRAEAVARQAGAEQSANLALGKAEQLTDQAAKARPETVADAEQVVVLWRQAEGLVEQAEGVLASALGAEAARERLAGRRREVAVGLRQAEAARIQARKEAKLLADLDTARALLSHSRGSDFDYESADRAYAAAVAAYGLDVLGPEPGAVAAAIRKERPTVRLALIVALDHWASCARDRAPRLQRVADLADDDGWRRRFRAAAAGRDLDELKRLAGEARGQPLPAVSLELLALALRDRGARAEAVALLRDARGRLPADFWIHFELGNCLHDPRHPDPATLDEALGCFWAAVALRPGSAPAHTNLGVALQAKGLLDEAIAEYQKAIALDPKHAKAHDNLGNALSAKGRLDEAIAEHQKAIALDHKDAKAHNNLGNALSAKGRLDEAIAAYRKAIALDPKLAKAHYNLGVALQAKGRLDEAIAEHQKAIALDHKDANAHTNFGVALQAKGRLDEAIAEHQKAIALDPKHAGAHYNLGVALYARGRLDEAIAEWHKAIDLDPKYAKAHNNLGNALYDKGLLDEAIAEYRKAIALDPTLAPAHNNLGNALYDKGRLDEAIAAYRKAIALDPKNAKAHGALGQALLQQGRFAEARDATRQALGLLPERDPLRARATQQLQACERLLELDKKFPAILAGKEQPRNPKDCAELGNLCVNYMRSHWAAAVRFYRKAFNEEPKLAQDLDAHHRYNAACAAAQASAIEADPGKLDDKERARLRKEALDWLRADLGAYTRLAENADARQAVWQRLTHWLKDADLAGVRGPKSLAALPEAERKEWQKLWADVAALLRKAEGE
jgi:eukaryotic-like serine/threonine-protein kinase